ncbi:unnamed protein product, partial [marine sediment metagenome]
MVLVGVVNANSSIEIEEVGIDDIELDEITPRVLERGSFYDIDILLDVEEEIENTRIKMALDSDEEWYTLGDIYFDDLDEGMQNIENSFEIASYVEEGSYDFEIKIQDKYGTLAEQTYPVEIVAKDHDLYIEYIWLESYEILAGEELSAEVFIENYGENDEEDVEIEINVYALDISITDTIDEIEVGEE